MFFKFIFIFNLFIYIYTLCIVLPEYMNPSFFYENHVRYLEYFNKFIF